MGIINTIRGYIARIKDDHVGAYASQAAYFIMLSFIPFIMLLISLIKYTPVTQEELQSAILSVFPPVFESFIHTILGEVFTKSFTIISVTAVAAIWSAARGLLAITNGLNSIYHVEETRNYFIMRIRSGFYTILFIIAIISSLVLLVFGNKIHTMLLMKAPFLARISGFIISIRTVGTLLVLTIVFVCMFKFLPNRKTKLSRQLPGAVVTAAAWTVFSFLFSIYVDYFSDLSYMYGSLTTIVIVMLWLYVCMYIILLGAEVNAYFEEKIQRMNHLAVSVFEKKEKETPENEQKSQE